MMLARVADSLYWLGRYAERAEHLSRLAAVMLNATLDRTDAADQAAKIAMAAVGDGAPPDTVDPLELGAGFGPRPRQCDLGCGLPRQRP